MFFAASFSVLSAAPGHAQTLEEELRALVQTNPRIEEQRAILRRAQEAVNSARSGYYPTVSITGSMGGEVVSNATTRGTNDDNDIVKFNALGLEIRQYLYDGGLTMNSVDSAVMARDSVTYALESTVQNVMLQGISAYLNVLRLNELIRVARARERTIREQAKLETERVERGAGIEVDVLQAKSRLQLAIEQRVDFEGQLRQAMSDYILSFNREPDITQMRLQPSPAEFVPPTLEDALLTARENNPLLIGREFIARSARFTVEAQRAGYFPIIDIVGRVDHENNVGGTLNLSKTSALLIEMSWEIFSGFATDAQVASAQESLLEQLAAGDRTVREIERQVRQAWTKLENTQERKALLLNAVSIAQEVFVARSKLRAAGKETTLNVLDAENEVFQAEQNLIRADYDTRVAVYELAAAMGLLSPAMLGLDVEVIEDKDFYLSADGDVLELAPDERVEAYRTRVEALEPVPLYTPPAPVETVPEEAPQDAPQAEEGPAVEEPTTIEPPPTTGEAPAPVDGAQPAPEPEPLTSLPSPDAVDEPQADLAAVEAAPEQDATALQDAVRAALETEEPAVAQAPVSDDPQAPAVSPAFATASESVSVEALPSAESPLSLVNAPTVPQPVESDPVSSLAESAAEPVEMPDPQATPDPVEAPVATAEAPVETAEAPVETAEVPVATAEVPVATAEVEVEEETGTFFDQFLDLFEAKPSTETLAAQEDTIEVEVAEEVETGLSLASGPEAIETEEVQASEEIDEVAMEEIGEADAAVLESPVPMPVSELVEAAPVAQEPTAPEPVTPEPVVIAQPEIAQPAPLPQPLAPLPAPTPRPQAAALPVPVAVPTPTPVPTVVPAPIPVPVSTVVPVTTPAPVEPEDGFAVFQDEAGSGESFDVPGSLLFGGTLPPPR